MDDGSSESDEATAANARPIVLVGLMGAGKSSVGRRLAKRLHPPSSLSVP